VTRISSEEEYADRRIFEVIFVQLTVTLNNSKIFIWVETRNCACVERLCTSQKKYILQGCAFDLAMG